MTFSDKPPTLQSKSPTFSITLDEIYEKVGEYFKKMQYAVSRWLTVYKSIPGTISSLLFLVVFFFERFCGVWPSWVDSLSVDAGVD